MFRSPLAAVLGAVFVTQLALFVTTIWLHRALSHRAMTVTPGVTRGPPFISTAPRRKADAGSCPA